MKKIFKKSVFLITTLIGQATFSQSKNTMWYKGLLNIFSEAFDRIVISEVKIKIPIKTVIFQFSGRRFYRLFLRQTIPLNYSSPNY
jgi:hypothetical protein